MASQKEASIDLAAPTTFGAWLRQLREEKSVAQRTVAAAADMDSSHYGKVESGKRLLTDEQLSVVAQFLGQPEAELRRRMAATQFLKLCGDDHALAADAAGLVQEAAAPYLAGSPLNRRPKKK